MQSFLFRTLVGLSLVLVTFSTACKKEESTESTTKYLHIDDPNGILYTKIFNSTLKVCLSNQTDEGDTIVPAVEKDAMNLLAKPAAPTTDALKPTITKAVLAWVNQLKDIAGTTPLISQVEVITAGCTNNIGTNAAIADVSVFVVSGQSGYSGLYHPTERPNTPYIQLFPKSDNATVLHEFGHAFGLGDTYHENKCMFGQPESIMCNRIGTIVSLQQDDIAGIRNKFCSIYKDRFPTCATVLTQSEPGMQPTTKVGKQNALSGIEVKDYKMTFYNYEYKKMGTSDLGQTFYTTIGSYTSKSPDNLEKAKALQPTYTVERRDEEFAGAMIVSVQSGSPGFGSLRMNQFITKIDEMPIKSAADFRNALEHIQSKSVKVEIYEYNANFREMTEDQIFLYRPEVDLKAKD